MKFNKTYLSDLTLSAVVNQFYDYLQDQLDAFIESSDENYNHSDNTYFAEAAFGDDSNFEIEIWYDGIEWQCKAY